MGKVHYKVYDRDMVAVCGYMFSAWGGRDATCTKRKVTCLNCKRIMEKEADDE